MAGYLKIILGYASGVGKSFRMLDEARRRSERGQDVVVGAIQARMSREVEAVLGKLEVIPLAQFGERSAMDVPAILKRQPAVCFIDGLAYDNPPGASNPSRWQDVEELLRAGIKVVASINIQYIDELRARVEAITGKHVRETVPISFLKSADEIEIVDAAPEQRVDGKLREMALVLTADVVDHQLAAYLEQHGIEQQMGAQERLLVCVTARANVRSMLETARTIAGRFHGELTVAYVNQADIAEQDRAAIEERLALAREAGAAIEILEGDDPVEAILEFAKARGITQLFIGHSQRGGVGARLWGTPVDKLIERSRGMDVRVFPQ